MDADEARVGRRDVRGPAGMALAKSAAAISASFGYFVIASPANTVEAQSGSRPTSDRTFSHKVAQACTGGFTSLKFHSYAGICPFGWDIPAAQHEAELPSFAKSESTSAS